MSSLTIKISVKLKLFMLLYIYLQKFGQFSFLRNDVLEFFLDCPWFKRKCL